MTVRVPGAPTGSADEQGNPVLAATVVSTVTIKAFAPRDSGESADNGPRVITGGTVYGYLGAEIPSNAILTIRGIDYQIEGEVGDWNPAYTGATETGATGIEFAVKRAS